MPGTILSLAQKPEQAEYEVPIRWDGLGIIARKISLGCEYKEMNKRFVESPYAVRICVAESDFVGTPFLSHRIINRKEINFGPGCQVSRTSPTEDENVVRYRILIWGKLCFHVLIDHEDFFLSEFDPKMKRVEGISPEGRKVMWVPRYLREFK